MGRVNITEPAFIEKQSFFLRVFVPKNIFPKTLPVREQVHSQASPGALCKADAAGGGH